MDNKITATASRSLPQAQPDASWIDPRFGRYGDQYNICVTPDMCGLSDEGSYFVGSINSAGTPGTGILFGGAAITSFTDSGAGAAGLVMMNLDANPTATIGKRIFIDYIKLICTVAVTGNTNWNLAGRLDNSLLRYTSGGTVITPVNSSMDSPSNSVCKLVFGNLTLAVATAAARTTFRQVARTVATSPGVNDEIIINFGAVEKVVGGQSLATAIPARLTFAGPPVILGPGQVFTLHGWGTGQSAAPTFEGEIGWWER